MAEVIILVGLPGAGKSNYVEQKLNQNKNIVVISSDTIREKKGYKNDSEGNKRTFFVFYRILKKSARKRKNIIIDATNLERDGRKRLINNIKKENSDYFIKVVYFDVPLDECIRRNNCRTKVVPEDVIRKYDKKLRFPELNEGIDEIEIIK